MPDALTLRGVIADPSLACTGFIADAERGDYAAAADALGYAVVAIGFEACRGKDDALARFARALRFPDGFDDSWDGLHACLSDLSWWPADGYLLLLDAVEGWRAADPDGFGITLEVLEQASHAWRDERIPFWAVVPVADPFAA